MLKVIQCRIKVMKFVAMKVWEAMDNNIARNSILSLNPILLCFRMRILASRKKTFQGISSH